MYGKLDLILQNKINRLLKSEQFKLQQLQNELQTTRGGKLYMKNAGTKIYYTEYSGGKEKGIGRNMDKVHRLARRNYIAELNIHLKNQTMTLNTLITQLNSSKQASNMANTLDRYEKCGLDMDKILLSPQQREWLAQPYERNPAYPEDLKFTTTKNVLMRTKSELIIANKLEHYNIPYLPEMPLWFAYSMYPIYPDFTILKPDGNTIIWEHMGRMDKEDYFLKNSRRILDYRHYNYSQHTNLIITFEEDVMDPHMIDHIIQTRILS